ncbi:hypothetical protein CYMTET_29191 [Cymbomonas tetramitiformis]|uniref:Sialidase domain-containing protein n=1 Tax=Cymbomonas tetramitiformis TaxID=36881 RepID=A0AAE0KV76_9CHLO|nr:hypothetical protein CYMTET_29191 [Cymbomonas tetramitiformis]
MANLRTSSLRPSELSRITSQTEHLKQINDEDRLINLLQAVETKSPTLSYAGLKHNNSALLSQAQKQKRIRLQQGSFGSLRNASLPTSPFRPRPSVISHYHTQSAGTSSPRQRSDWRYNMSTAPRSESRVTMQKVGDFAIASIPKSPVALPRLKASSAVAVASEAAKCTKHPNDPVRYDWIFRANATLSYVHMATITDLPGGGLASAWQAAANAEGNDDQVLMFSRSFDGGHTWSTPSVVPGRAAGIRWSPVLFTPPGAHGGVHLFFAESRGCWFCESDKCNEHQRQNGFAVPEGAGRRRLLKHPPGAGVAAHTKKKVPKSTPENLLRPQWRPGGDVKMMTISLGTLKWSDPHLVYVEASDGHIPKVIGNPPIAVTLPGAGRRTQWLLPYWREKPRGRAVCTTKAPDYSGVLTSVDAGARWKAVGRIEHAEKVTDGSPRPDWLIEGSIVQLRNGSLLQLFRTNRGVAYSTLADPLGAHWEVPRPTTLQNPNSKVNVIRLSTGALACAHNDHEYTKTAEGVMRGRLIVSFSYDDGDTWSDHRMIDERTEPGRLIHYPTLLEQNCKLYVTYSIGGEGIRLASFWI